MEFKGTKGNWEVMPKAKFNIQSLNGSCVASCGVRSSNTEDLTEELLANAKLIAAAPDLLEALQDAIKLLRQTTEYEVLDNFKTEVERLNKAIEKALK